MNESKKQEIAINVVSKELYGHLPQTPKEFIDAEQRARQAVPEYFGGEAPEQQQKIIPEAKAQFSLQKTQACCKDCETKQGKIRSSCGDGKGYRIGVWQA